MSTALQQRIAFAFLMSLLMSFLMTFWVSWLNIGFQPDFLGKWRHAFLAAWPVAFVIVVLCGPAVMALSQRLMTWLRPAILEAGAATCKAR
jgi:hypothetical protein